MRDTREYLFPSDFPSIKRIGIKILQVNLGYLCNLSCSHCHVNAGPTRTELMTRETIDLVLSVLDRYGIQALDLTGGAPELNPHFKYLVRESRKRGVHVIDRCNLTVLLESGQEDLAQFLADQQVEICASLPCYNRDNVDAQRGQGVFQGSIKALQVLNNLGFGRLKTLPLTLVYNPGGAFLPPDQPSLERDYQEHLKTEFGIDFNHLLTITNMPISRFGAQLLAKNTYHQYMALLKDNYRAENLSSVMCRELISVDWQGNIYDCDFNQMLDLPVLHRRLLGAEMNKTIATDAQRAVSLEDLLESSLADREIRVADHCYGCTAGSGSSCSGALS